MNTKQRNRLKSKKRAYDASKGIPEVPTDTRRGQPLVDITNTLQSVNTKAKDAKANEVSMDDNNEGRIWYNWLWQTLKREQKDNKK